MTIDEIKRGLPDVKVRVSSDYIKDGRISGRQNKYATVSLKSAWGDYTKYQFSWRTIQHHLETGEPLTI